MAQVEPPGITPSPTRPVRGTPTFKTLVDAFVTWLTGATGQFQALATNVYNNALDCFANTNIAKASADTATIQATAAISGVNAVAWVSGTGYIAGQTRYSPLNGKLYMRLNNGAGVVDPRDDPANWVNRSAADVASTAEIKTGTEAIKVITPAGLRAAVGFSAGVPTADQTITVGGALTIAHGLVRTPVLFHGFLKNVTAELGYVPGDITPVNLGADTGANNAGVAVTADATNIYVRYCAAPSSFSIIDKSSGGCSVITNVNWKFFLRVLA